MLAFRVRGTYFTARNCRTGAQTPRSVIAIVSTVHCAVPGARTTDGLKVHVVVVSQPAWNGVSVTSTFTACVLSMTFSTYLLAEGTALHEKVGVTAADAPLAGLSSVGGTTRMTVNDAVATFPTVSFAFVVMTLMPGLSMIVAVQLVVPDAVPVPPRLFAHDTNATPALSDAVPPTTTPPWIVSYVVPLRAGDVIAIAGAV